MNLHRLIYTSARRPSCTDEEIQKILDSARRNNPKLNITGVLLHSKKRFLQYLEGDSKEIKALYEKITEDDRHGGAAIRDYSPIIERVFPSWEMGYKDISDDELKFNTNITPQDRKTFEELLDGKLEEGDMKAKVVKRFFLVTE